jgi:hypothetical protein
VTVEPMLAFERGVDHHAGDDLREPLLH